MSHDTAMGKKCPACSAPMVDLRSLNLRQCVGCRREFDWHLADGQRPLIGSNRVDRKENAQ